MKPFIFDPSSAFLSELIEETPVELKNRQQFLQRIYAVHCAVMNGYADMSIICPISSKYINPFNGGYLTKSAIIKAYNDYYKKVELDANEHNFYTYPIKFTNEEIINIKNAGIKGQKELIEKLANLTDEEWVDAYGYFEQDLTYVYNNCTAETSREDFLKLTKRQRTAHTAVLAAVHVGMQSVAEDIYDVKKAYSMCINEMLGALEDQNKSRHYVWLRDLT